MPSQRFRIFIHGHSYRHVFGTHDQKEVAPWLADLHRGKQPGFHRGAHDWSVEYKHPQHGWVPLADHEHRSLRQAVHRRLTEAKPVSEAWHPRGEPSWPNWKTAKPGTRISHVRTGRTGTLRKVVVSSKSASTRHAVIQWDHDQLGRHIGPGQGVTGRVVAPAFDLEELHEALIEAWAHRRGRRLKKHGKRGHIRVHELRGNTPGPELAAFHHVDDLVGFLHKGPQGTTPHIAVQVHGRGFGKHGRGLTRREQVDLQRRLDEGLGEGKFGTAVGGLAQGAANTFVPGLRDLPPETQQHVATMVTHHAGYAIHTVKTHGFRLRRSQPKVFGAGIPHPHPALVEAGRAGGALYGELARRRSNRTKAEYIVGLPNRELGRLHRELRRRNHPFAHATHMALMHRLGTALTESEPRKKRVLSAAEREQRRLAGEARGRQEAQRAIRRGVVGAQPRAEEPKVEEKVKRTPKPRPGPAQANAPRDVRRAPFAGRRIRAQDVRHLKPGDQVRFQDGEREGWGQVVEHRHSQRAGHRSLVLDQNGQFREVPHADVTHAARVRDSAEREERLRSFAVQAQAHVSRAGQDVAEHEQSLAQHARALKLRRQERKEVQDLVAKRPRSRIERRRLASIEKQINELAATHKALKAQPSGQERLSAARGAQRAAMKAVTAYGGQAPSAPAPETEGPRELEKAQVRLKQAIAAHAAATPMRWAKWRLKPSAQAIAAGRHPEGRYIPESRDKLTDEQKAAVDAALSERQSAQSEVTRLNRVVDKQKQRERRAIKPAGGGEMGERAVGRVSDVRGLAPGDQVRYSGEGRSRSRATVVRNYRTKKGAHKLLVHDQAGGFLGEIDHGQVTHVQPAQSEAEQESRLRTARTVAHGVRSRTQHLGPTDPERTRAASHARRTDEALAGIGIEPKELDPKRLATLNPELEGGEDEEPVWTPPPMGRPDTRDTLPRLKSAEALRYGDPVAYLDAPHPKDDPDPEAHHQGVVVHNDPKARTVDVYHRDQGRVEQGVPYANLHPMHGRLETGVDPRERISGVTDEGKEFMQLEEPAPAPHPPFEPQYDAMWGGEPDVAAHPGRMRVGDEVRFLQTELNGGPVLERQPGVQRSKTSANPSKHGIVLEHNKRAGTMKVLSEGKVRMVPYVHVHHVRQNDYPTRVKLITDNVSGPGLGAAQRRALAAVGARTAHDVLTDEYGAPAWFRSPTWTFYHQDRQKGLAHHWPSVAGDRPGTEEYRTGGVTPFLQGTNRKGELPEPDMREALRPPRESRLFEARRARRQPEFESDGIPRIGFGTSELPGEKAYEPTLMALRNGYRHIDTAAYYKNEEQVGRALKRSGVPRDQVHLTTKVWTDKFGDVAGSLDDSLKKLGTDHVDLLHAHWPKTQWTRSATSGDQAREDIAKLMRGLQVARQTGKAKRIGVSNFPRELMSMAHDIVPLDAIQVEGHPHLYQPSLMNAATQRGIHTTLYAPLGSGRGPLADPVVKDIAQKRGISPAQTALAWVLNVADSTPPRSTSDEHQRENLAARPDMLDGADVRALTDNALIKHRRYFNSPDTAPNWDWGGNYAKG